MTISAVLPTLNEAATIGPIVEPGAARADGARAAARRAGGRSTPIRTTTRRQIAADEGARVVRPLGRAAAATAATAARARRSGRASIATTGDLIAWSDTDIVDWHPRFLYGTLGPLLAERADRLRQGLLPTADRRGRAAQGGWRRARHGARGSAADQPVLPRAVGLHPAARRRVRRPPRRTWSRSRSSPAMPSRSGTSSTSPSGSISPAWARWISTCASTATRSSKAFRG